MQEGSITLQLSQSDRWAIKDMFDRWEDDSAEEIFLSSALAIKDKTFGNAGIQLQYNTGSPRGYIGDGANAFWKFDGTKLTWKAANSELDASGNFQCTGGTIGGWTINATTIAKSTSIILDAGANPKITINNTAYGDAGIQLEYNGAHPRFYCGDGANAYVKFDGTKLQWKGTNSELDSSGNIVCTGGQIGGWYISSTSLYSTGSSIYLSANARKITINDTTYGNKGIQLDYNSGSPRFYCGDGANAYVKFDGTKLQWKGSNSELDASGNIICTGGTIGGFTLSSTTLANGTDIILDASNKKISINSATFGNDGIQLDYNGGNPRFYVGDGANKWVKFDGTNLQVAEGEIKKVALTDAITLGDGSTISGTITLNISDGDGDCYIAAGKSDFTTADAGFILGQDDSDSNKAKLYIGDATNYFYWDGSKFVLNVESEDAIIIGSGGNIKLISADANPGAIEFVGTDNSILLTGLDAEGCEIYLLPNSEESSEQILCAIGDYTHRWDNIYLICSIQTDIICYLDSNNYSAFQVGADTNECNIDMDCTISGTTKTVRAFYNTDSPLLYFSPLSNKEWDLGQSDNAWDDAYADDWNNVADFFYLDDRDDLAALGKIKGSGTIDERTGLELIDDGTLPEWMLVKDKHTGKVTRDPDGKPYISTKMFLSLLRGAICQLDRRVQ